MAGTINVSGVFIFTVAASNAIYNEVTCNLAAIKMSAYNVQEQPVVFTFKKVDGDRKTALTAYPTLTVYNRSGASLTDHKPSSATSISYTIPVGSLPTADRVTVRIYSDDARTVLLAESVSIGIVRENPMPFPRGEAWAADMVFKNGEMLLLDNMAYMWCSPVAGNSSVHPKTDIASNPTTTCWVAYQEWPILCTHLMMANMAIIAGAVHKDGQLFSQKGTVNEVVSFDYRNPNFKPNLRLNFLDGDAELAGKIEAKENSKIAGMEVKGNSLRGVQAIFGKYKYTVTNNTSDKYTIINNIERQLTYFFEVPNDDKNMDCPMLLPSAHDLLLKGIEEYTFELTIVTNRTNKWTLVLKGSDDAGIYLNGVKSSVWAMAKGEVMKLIYYANGYYIVSNTKL